MQSTLDPAKDLQPLLHSTLTLSPDLPVNVFTRYLEAEAPGQPEEKIRSVANLYQTVLELERDGDLLQDLYRFYIALKLPVYVGQLGLPGSDSDFLLAAQKLAGKSCASPVDLSVPAWQIAGRKIWNWSEKNLHIRDANTIANELLAEPKISTLIPAMKALPTERIAIIGHSFTMDQHWSSPLVLRPHRDRHVRARKFTCPIFTVVGRRPDLLARLPQLLRRRTRIKTKRCASGLGEPHPCGRRGT
jgi:hypothetical protein